MNFRENRFLVATNGCPRRSMDTEKLKRYILANKGKITTDPKMADYIFFVSCGFDSHNQKVSASYIKLLYREQKNVFVLGCLPSINPDLINKKLVQIPTKDINLLDKYFSDLAIKWDELADSNQVWVASIWQRLKSGIIAKSRSILREVFKYYLGQIRNSFYGYLRISWGCASNCSYCGIRLAIGSLKSKPLDIVVAEYKSMLKKGINKIVILGDNTGAYGVDSGSNFGILLKTLDEVTSNNQIKWTIQEIHPIWVVMYEKELEILIEKGRIATLHVPIQSGSEKILKLMHRPLDIAKFTRILQNFTKKNPALRLDTHIIVGFPNKSEDDFNKTATLLNEIKFHTVDVFKYTDIIGSVASKMTGKIPKPVIEKRAQFLNDLVKAK